MAWLFFSLVNMDEYLFTAKQQHQGPEQPKFLLALQSCSAFDGEEVILTCTVTGRPKPQVNWYHNDKCIDKSEDFVISYDIEAGKADCMIVECLPDDQGSFKCIATNEAGQAVTECNLTIYPAPPKKKTQPKPKPQPVQEMIMPEIIAVAHAAVPTEKEVKITKKEELIVEGEARLDTETVLKTDVKTVRKIVKKASGEPPRFFKPMQPQVVKEGETAQFVASVNGAPTPDIAWLKDKKEFGPTDRIKMEFDNKLNICRLTMTNCTQDDIGVYSCRATNTAGRATCTANIVVVRKYHPKAAIPRHTILTCCKHYQLVSSLTWFHTYVYYPTRYIQDICVFSCNYSHKTFTVFSCKYLTNSVLRTCISNTKVPFVSPNKTTCLLFKVVGFVLAQIMWSKYCQNCYVIVFFHKIITSVKVCKYNFVFDVSCQTYIF